MASSYSELCGYDALVSTRACVSGRDDRVTKSGI
jgi:hypothetical protein